MVKILVGELEITGGNLRESVKTAIAQFESPGEKPDLEEIRAWAMGAITRQRGEARRPYLTDTFGQSLVYADKERQARVWFSDREPNPKDYPLLYGRQAEFLGLTPEGMATIILEKAREWHIASDQIDAAAYLAATETEQAATSGAIAEILIGFCEEIYDLALDSAK